MKRSGPLADLIYSAVAGGVSYGIYHLSGSILVAVLVLTAFVFAFLWIHARQPTD